MSLHGIAFSHSLLGSAAFGVAVALTRLAWTRRDRPGAGSLTAIGGLLALGSLAHLFMFVFPGQYREPWILTMFNVSGFAAVFGFLFAIRFTGRGQWLTPSVRVLLISLPVVLLVVSVLPMGLGIEATSRAGLLSQRLIGLVSQLLTPLYVIAAAIFLWAALSRDAVPYGQVLLLVGSLLVLALSPVASAVFSHSTRILPAVLLLGGGGLLAATCWYRPFERLPVARPAVQSRIVDELSEPVVASDRKGRVVDLNAAAKDTFGHSQSVVGHPVHRVLDDAVVADGQRRLIQVDDSVLTAIPETVTTTDGNPIGTVLLFTDATDQRLRERRARLLTELLSEVIGTQFDEIARLAASVGKSGAADTPGDVSGEPPVKSKAVGAEIQARSQLLLSVGKRAREIERSLAEPPLETPTALLTEIRTAATRSSIQSDEYILNATGASYTVAVPRALLVAGFAAVFDAVAIRDESATVSFEVETDRQGTATGLNANDRSGPDGHGAASDQVVESEADAEGQSVHREPSWTASTHDRNHDGVVHVEVRLDSCQGSADSVIEPTADHPAAKLLSLVAVEAGGSVGLDRTPWKRLRIALPVCETRSAGDR